MKRSNQLIVLGLLLAFQCVNLQRHNFSGPRPIVNHPQLQAHRQQAPQQQPKDSKCALLIPSGTESICISYDAVNSAFAKARDSMRLTSPAKGKEPTDMEVDLLGRTLVETSRILAEQFNLPADAVHSGLPLIDTKHTAIAGFCPTKYTATPCQVQRYRELDGRCNNVENPNWGSTLAAFRRLLPPNYSDGVNAPRISASGQPLPTARLVSSINHKDLGFHDHAVTVYLPAWGQLIDHDMALGAETKEPKTDHEPKCCDVSPNNRHPACWPIDIPPNDPFYSLFRRTCLDFVRSANGVKNDCKLGARNTMNVVSSYLDASFVYGIDEERARELRTMKGGQLKSNAMNRHKGMKDLLPPKMKDPDAGCKRPNKDVFCFMAGDDRVNQQMMLVALHTIMMREHNRIASELSKINPHWDDEKLYQETRHIVAALVQQITYNEFLPMVLGKDVMERFDLLPLRDGYSNTYNPKLEATLPVGFFAAAFRFGHSLIPSAIERWSTTHKFVGAKRLSEMINKPFDVYNGDTCDQYLTGFMNQISQAVDDAMSQELTNHLFKEDTTAFGTDLASLNIQRGRDHGVPSYNTWREFCGLKRANSWNDLNGVFTNETLQRYSSLYASVDDIDLWSAGVSERPSPGSMVGPTFGCIMGHTFRNLRFGDRFWYENGGQPSSFTLEQLNEIRRVKLSRVICDNSDHIDSVQVYVMVLPDPEINPRVACKSSVLPRLNLLKWKE